jgi:hypothetical protein
MLGMPQFLYHDLTACLFHDEGVSLEIADLQTTWHVPGIAQERNGPDLDGGHVILADGYH